MVLQDKIPRHRELHSRRPRCHIAALTEMISGNRALVGAVLLATCVALYYLTRGGTYEPKTRASIDRVSMEALQNASLEIFSSRAALKQERQRLQADMAEVASQKEQLAVDREEVSRQRLENQAASQAFEKSKTDITTALERQRIELDEQRRRLDAAMERLTAERADLERRPCPTPTTMNMDVHNHGDGGAGMHPLPSNSKALHSWIGRNDVNKWSTMELDRDMIRNMAHTGPRPVVCERTFLPSYWNDSDPRCLIDYSSYMARIPINFTLEASTFEWIRYYPYCAGVFATEACDFVRAHDRLLALARSRKQQPPLPVPSPPPAARDPNSVHLAYFIAAYRSEFLLADCVQGLEKLLRRLNHPNDLVVLHLDRRSGATFAEVVAAMVVAGNLTNLVVEFLEPSCIFPSGSSETQMQLNGFRRLLARSPAWDHAIYLSGLEFPLRTRAELVAALEPGMSYFPLRPLDAEELRTKYYPEMFREWLTDCANPTMNARLVMGQRALLPELAYAHSDNVYMLSRELVSWLIDDEFAQLLWLYFRTTRHAQEHYIPTAVLTDGRFVERVVRRSLTYFQLESARKSSPLHEGRFLRNTTADVAGIQRAHASGDYFFVHKPRPTLHKLIDHLRDPSFVNTDPEPSKGHEH